MIEKKTNKLRQVRTFQNEALIYSLLQSLITNLTLRKHFICWRHTTCQNYSYKEKFLCGLDVMSVQQEHSSAQR